MDLGMAAHEAGLLAEELQEGMSDAEVQKLWEELRGTTRSAWFAYVRGDRNVAEFAVATPSERKKKKAWQDPAVQRSLRAAAVVRLQYAAQMLESLDVCRPCSSSSYRGAIRGAASAWQDASEMALPLWPFDIPDGEPFAS
ncbi:MAG: hypothetical protein A3K18_13535 [Lentisphaerae bacterium RIFOXYA12_64_32]|nr:MAG: hypothetical protein A3K18_13535 [Lentisphaerae bacterium RIFOXYA12_64_32]